LLSLAATTVLADKGRDDQSGRSRAQTHESKLYRLDQRHSHNRFYPNRGSYVDRLPSDRIIVPFHNERFYFDRGVWYRPSGSRFVVVAPPIGLSISILPPFYTTLWVGGVPYYYADGVYYNWRPVERRYIVVEPPRETEITRLPPASEPLFIYPKTGQNEQQQATDRYECHRWAVDQTGFDPTQPGQSGVPESDYTVKSADYQRATKACLEARDYSVR
jgi:hypothetical protein